MFENLQEASIGVIVQNPQGEVMVALSEMILMSSSVVLLETLAIRRAILFVYELGFRRPSFEGDLAISINVLRLISCCIHSWGILLKTLYLMLALYKASLSSTIFDKAIF